MRRKLRRSVQHVGGPSYDHPPKSRQARVEEDEVMVDLRPSYIGRAERQAEEIERLTAQLLAETARADAAKAQLENLRSSFSNRGELLLGDPFPLWMQVVASFDNTRRRLRAISEAAAMAKTELLRIATSHPECEEDRDVIDIARAAYDDLKSAMESVNGQS
jgi:hypothetical protein